MRAAIIGGGFAGKLHIQALRKCGVEPYLLIAGSKESAQKTALELEIPCWFQASEEGYAALSDPSIDTVHVCTPPSSHAKAIRAALQAGKHVLSEKPLALQKDEALSLANAAKEKNLVTACVFNVRYHMAVQRIREILRSGELGKPLLIHGSYLQEFHAPPAPYDWRYDPVLGGDLRAVTEIGTHWFDVVQYVTGQRICSLRAVTENFWPVRSMMMPDGASREVTVSSEDAAVITLRFDGGALGSVVLSEVSPGRGNYLSFEITCERGNLWWDEEENNHLHISRKGEGIRTEVFAFGNGFPETFEALTADFCKAVKNRIAGNPGEDAGACVQAEPVLPTFADGARIVSVCDAVRSSAAAGGDWTGVFNP